MFELDPKHESFDIYDDLIVKDVWAERYFLPNESSPDEVFSRVANTIYAKDPNLTERANAYQAMTRGLLMPAGRILNGQGTMMNCFVSRTIDDSIDGIYQSLGEAMLTLSKFGGIGMDFSTIRPTGAKINRAGLTAPGPITFMDLWHESANRIMQAGHRRGAMMGVMADTHPDLPNFITAKQKAGRLTNFNISVLISDEFMNAVREDKDWCLHFTTPPAEVRPAGQIVHDFTDEQGYHYVYSVWRARELWEMIMKATYEFAEPGVIFVDTINRMNNLQYCETIKATNPCGEQPLPPFGTCNLGAINLARMVRNPFSMNAEVDWQLLTNTVATGVRFLDNVIDVTDYPLVEQRAEEIAKRRLGLGISGLADMLGQLGLRYGSPEAVKYTKSVMLTLSHQAYLSSVDLAEERGPFPMYNPKFWDSGYAAKRVPASIRDQALKGKGIRNGTLLTIAPTGTTSIVFGNISSGIEPTFVHNAKRKIWGKDGVREVDAQSFISRFYHHCVGNENLPDYLVTADQVAVGEHVAMQEACQYYVDASVSKTINCPESTPFEDFANVYMNAYESGCKGCTTYRPSKIALEVRGTVIENADKPKTTPTGRIPEDPELQDLPSKFERPRVLAGCTYKISWPSMEASVYVTINERNGSPYEVFIHSRNLRNIEWQTLSSVLISRSLKYGAEPLEIAEQLQQIQGASTGAWIDKKYYSSIVAYIGEILLDHFKRFGTDEVTLAGGSQLMNADFAEAESRILASMTGEGCPKCGAPMLRTEGCKKCSSCDFSTCG